MMMMIIIIILRTCMSICGLFSSQQDIIFLVWDGDVNGQKKTPT